MKEQDQKEQGSYSKSRIAAICLFLAAALVFGSIYTYQIRSASKEIQANDTLAQPVISARQQAVEQSMDPKEAPDLFAQYCALWEENNDFSGWLSIPDTPVDYPVMFTPEEPERYLRRAFDGSSAVSGSLFIGEGCTPDSSHVIVYGHQMKNGSMFGTLEKYSKKEYADAHPTVRFDTLEESREYQILAAFYSRVYNDQDGPEAFRYYQYADLSQPETFAEYVSRAKQSSLYDTGVEAEFGDRLITLSTCSNHTQDGRFVVIARYHENTDEKSVK